jgi:hypothetical protein
MGILRDLYALCGFYVEHPEHPLPKTIVVYHAGDEPTVRAVAAKHADGRVWGAPGMTTHELPGTSVPVQMIVTPATMIVTPDVQRPMIVTPAK